MNETIEKIFDAKLKIAVLGAAGTGKTTAAVALATKLGIPFISAPTAMFTKKYGVATHPDVIKLCAAEPEKGIQLHREIMEGRSELLRNAEGPWITDRSCIDTFVYYLMQCSMFDTEENTEAMFDVALQESQIYDMIFGFHAGTLHVSSPARVRNNHWHKSYELIFKKIILECKRRVLYVEEPDGAVEVSERVDVMIKAIGDFGCSRV